MSKPPRRWNGAIGRQAPRRLLPALAALFGTALAGAPAFSSDNAAWKAHCAALETETDAAQRAVAARECALSLEREYGLDDARLVGRYARIAETLAEAPGAGASQAALPYWRRAHRAAQRLYGAGSPKAGAAALDYARASILAGRCTAQDDLALGLLDDAATGLRAAEGEERLGGLRAVASGYADGLAYEKAASLLVEAGGEDGAALQDLDWERIGDWRHRSRDVAGAAEAYRRALSLDPASHDRQRIRQSLMQTLFELGDLESLEKLRR